MWVVSCRDCRLGGLWYLQAERVADDWKKRGEEDVKLEFIG